MIELAKDLSCIPAYRREPMTDAGESPAGDNDNEIIPKQEDIAMTYDKKRVQGTEEHELTPRHEPEPEYVVPDPESYPGYGWGWHGPWDDEYWEENGPRPDER